jgi:oligopeptide transport system permease protein
MISGLANRLFWWLVTLLAISAITFFLMNLVPGGPFATLDTGRSLPTEAVREIERQYGLDKPLFQQYLIYLGNLLRGDLGRSLARNEPVGAMLARALPVSLVLGGCALLLAVAVGLPLGVIAAIRQGSWIDHVATGISILSVSTPGFVLGMLLIIVLSLQLGLLPVAGWGSWQQAILPIIALSMQPLSIIVRYTRSAMLEVLNQLYVTVARSKGLRERFVISRHALKNAMIPVVTVIGLLVPQLLIGSFLIETLFAVPGSGRFFVVSVTQRDYPVIMSVAILYGWLVTAVNFAVDLIYQYLDPRITL